MSLDFIRSFHDAAKFKEIVSAAGIEGIIADYEAQGPRFFYIDRSACSIAPDTGYNRDCRSEGRQYGDVYIDSSSLEGFGLGPVEGFTCQTFHELGHFEADRRGLNWECELLAWEFAGDIASSYYVDGLPEWWARVRREVLAGRGIEWDGDTAKACRAAPCEHRPGLYEHH